MLDRTHPAFPFQAKLRADYLRILRANTPATGGLREGGVGFATLLGAAQEADAQRIAFGEEPLWVDALVSANREYTAPTIRVSEHRRAPLVDVSESPKTMQLRKGEARLFPAGRRRTGGMVSWGRR